MRSAYRTVKSSPLTTHRVLMPRAEDGQAVSMILGAATFEPALPPQPGADQPASYLEIIE